MPQRRGRGGCLGAGELGASAPYCKPIALGIAASLHALPLYATAPSFDCRTAKTGRELGTCADARLAAADRELAAVLHQAVTQLDAPTAAALRQDQQRFLVGLDLGFEGEVWGKPGPPPADAMRQQVEKLRRGGEGDYLAALEAQLRERIAFLQRLSPATGFEGLWKNADAELLIVAADRNRYQVTFGLTSFGWEREHCHFGGEFKASDQGLIASQVANTDPEINESIATGLVIARAGSTLSLTENFPKPEDSVPRRVCPRAPALTGPFFHTSLKPGQAYRLTPDADSSALRPA